jgi:tetratricopeptide (TPR) repeat protein
MTVRRLQCEASLSGKNKEHSVARLADAEATLVKALSLIPDHAQAHMLLGFVQISTNRAAQAIAECEQALSLDRNLAAGHGWIGIAKVYMGRAEETEAHIREALRLSPRDTGAYRWVHFIGVAKMHLNAGFEAVVWLRRGVELNRNYAIGHFRIAAGRGLATSTRRGPPRRLA